MSSHSSEERSRRALSFNEDAECYDRARPTYPDEVFEKLWEMAELGPNPKILEVGCGTGQASVSLARRGALLTCVEAGSQMASIATSKLANFPGSRVMVSKFEDWDGEPGAYDLVFASASWHWIEPNVRYVKAKSALKMGGHVAVMASEHFFPIGFDPLFDQIQDVYSSVIGSRRIVEAQELPLEGEFNAKDLDHVAEMERAGGFERATVTRVLWHFDRTADQYVELLATYSDHWALDPETRSKLLEGVHNLIARSPSGSVRKHYLTTIRVARTEAHKG